jgi:large subunit ribosomal protein L28
MARRCDITGVGAQSGHLVSHSNHKTNTSFRPNLQNVSLVSDALGTRISLRITAATLRSIEHNGGLDQYLINHSSRKLTPEAGRLKRQIEKKIAKVAAKAA